MISEIGLFITKIGLFITNSTDKDIEIFECEPISIDRDKYINLGVIKKHSGLIVYPKTDSIIISEKICEDGK